MCRGVGKRRLQAGAKDLCHELCSKRHFLTSSHRLDRVRALVSEFRPISIVRRRRFADGCSYSISMYLIFFVMPSNSHSAVS
jgi:hypothetical protein